MNVALITCVYRRHKCLQRILRFFLDQDYEGEQTLLIYNNAPEIYQLPELHLSCNKHIILVNNSVDLITKDEYKNTGAIFRDALSFVPGNTNIVNHFDSDDLFLPRHISEGVIGMKEAYKLKKLGYKPYKSYFWYNNKLEKQHNTMEPSIFIDYEFLKSTGYRYTTVDYNQEWEEKLKFNNLLHTPEAPVTMIYNWNGLDGVHKISGGNNDNENFYNHRCLSNDKGEEKMLIPISSKEAKEYYKLTKNI